MAKKKPLTIAGLEWSGKNLGDEVYAARLAELQRTLVQIQQAYLVSEHSAVVVFEGWDAAGKGGTIRRIASVLDPRSFKVWPIAAPSEADLRRHYMARFWDKLPERGSIAVFDRSWYGRVLVERVEHFAPKRDWKRAYGEIEDFEATLTASGTRLVKIFLAISKEEQLKRFIDRMEDPLKRWKLSVDDFRNREKWDDYVEAADAMFAKTSTVPWHLVAANQKAKARVEALQVVVDVLSEGMDLAPRPLDPRVAEEVARLKAERQG